MLEAKHDNDTIYNDAEVKRRLTELESKPTVDTSFFVTEEKLNSKGYISDISGLATKQELANAVTKDELEAKHYVTEEELNNKAYLTQQNLDNYALKSELPTPYNDSLLNERVTALESKAIEGGAYDDTDLRNRVINLENKPALDTSEFVTNQALESRGYIKDINNLVTKDELQGKHYISDISNLVTKEELENKGYLKIHQSLDNVVTKEELATKGYITDVSNLVTKEAYNEEIGAINVRLLQMPSHIYNLYGGYTRAKEYLDNTYFVSGDSAISPNAGKIFVDENGYQNQIQIFKGDANNSQFVDFNAVMYSLANSLPTGYSIESLSQDINSKVLFLSNKNFSEVVPRDELKAIIKEVLTELKSENN